MRIRIRIKIYWNRSKDFVLVVLTEGIIKVFGVKESLTTIQSKYFIYILTYIVGQKNYFQFSSRVYSRLNEVWNMIYTNVPF